MKNSIVRTFEGNENKNIITLNDLADENLNDLFHQYFTQEENNSNQLFINILEINKSLIEKERFKNL